MNPTIPTLLIRLGGLRSPKNMQSETATRQEPFQAMDKLDEDQIVAELKGDVIEAYFYEVNDQGNTRIGISYSGIKYVLARMSERGHAISVDELYVAESLDGKSYQAKAKAIDLATREVRWGTAEQPKNVRKYVWKNGVKSDEYTEELNPFAYVLAGSKAQRNAMRHFVAEVAIQEGYKVWKSNKSKPAAPTTK